MAGFFFPYHTVGFTQSRSHTVFRNTLPTRCHSITTAVNTYCLQMMLVYVDAFDVFARRPQIVYVCLHIILTQDAQPHILQIMFIPDVHEWCSHRMTVIKKQPKKNPITQNTNSNKVCRVGNSRALTCIVLLQVVKWKAGLLPWAEGVGPDKGNISCDDRERNYGEAVRLLVVIQDDRDENQQGPWLKYSWTECRLVL